MKEINLEEIISNQYDYRSVRVYNKADMVDAMKEAIRQALEIASENAWNSYSSLMWSEEFPIEIEQSILDVIKLVK